MKHQSRESYALYLLSPKELVRYLSINLYSSRLNLWGDTFFTTAILKMSNEKFVWWTSLACIESADFSHFSPLKHPRWPLERSWDSCIVRPKYVSFSPHNLQIHMYIMFLDLQLRCRGMLRVFPFISTMFSSLINGHWRQPRPLQCWSSIVLGGKLKCLSPVNFWRLHS